MEALKQQMDETNLVANAMTEMLLKQQKSLINWQRIVARLVLSPRLSVLLQIKPIYSHLTQPLNPLEQGRGFAGVADEVRSLAFLTQTATNEIQVMVTNLHTGISGAVSAMKANISQVNSALTGVETSRTSFDSISLAIESINEMNSHIAATEQQKVVSDEMNENVTKFAKPVKYNQYRCHCK